MSKYSTNKVYFTKRLRVAYLFLVIVGLFLITGNYLLGETFIKYLMGKQWLGLVHPFQYFIISTALYYLITFNKYTISALGKPNINLKIEGIYSIFRISGLFIIFLFFRDNTNIIYLLIGLDIVSRLLMTIIQANSMSIMLNHNLKLFIIGSTALVIFTGVTSIIFNINYFYYIVLAAFIIIFQSYRLFSSYKISISKA